MKSVKQLLTRQTPQTWTCLCGEVIAKKGAALSGDPTYKYGIHVHCPKCSRTVAQFVDPKETM